MSKANAKKEDEKSDGGNSEKLQIPTGDCNVCDKLAKNLCSACKYVFYCGRDCQKKDWNSHKEDCKAFAKLPYRVNIFLWDPICFYGNSILFSKLIGLYWLLKLPKLSNCVNVEILANLVDFSTYSDFDRFWSISLHSICISRRFFLIVILLILVNISDVGQFFRCR